MFSNNGAHVQCNKLMKLDNTMLMYGIYNAETLEKLIKTVHEIHNATSSQENYLQESMTIHYLEYFTLMPQACNNMQLIPYFSSESFKINT